MSRLLLLLLWSLWALPAWAGPGTVAVLYFDNRGQPELEALKVGLSQMLITDLQAGEGESWTVVERGRIQAVMDELKLGHSGVVDPATAAKVGRLLGAEWLVLGGYFQLGEVFRVDASLVKVETGVITFAHGENGPPASFIELEQKLALALRGALQAQVNGAVEPGEAQPEGQGAATPQRTRSEAGTTTTTRGEVLRSGGAVAALAAPDPDAVSAAVAFSQGLVHLDQHDLPRAREAFEQALAQDPGLAAARAQLASLEL